LIPRDKQLIRTACDAVTRMLANPEFFNVPDTLENVRTALNEVLLRYGEDFYHDYYQQGRVLSLEAKRCIESLDEKTPGSPVSFPSNEELHGNMQALGEAIRHVSFYNALAIDRLAKAKNPFAEDLKKRIIDWELTLYHHRMKPALEGKRVSADTFLTAGGFTAGGFEAYLQKNRPVFEGVSVNDVRRIPGGYSKITILVEIEDERIGKREIVLRAEPPRRMLDLDGMLIESEFPVVQFVHRAGLPVPEPLFLELDTSHLGLRFAVFQKMPGTILGTFKEAEAAVDDELIKAIIQLMIDVSETQIDPQDTLIKTSYLSRWTGYGNLPDNTAALVNYWYEVGLRGNIAPSPLLQRSYRWLLDNVPDENADMCLVHGDIGFHNILFDGDRVSALLDWENSRYGDVAEDLSLFIQSTKSQVGRDQIIAWYNQFGGQQVSDYRLRYFDVFHCFKIVVSALVSLQRVEEQPDGHEHLAAFGLKWLYDIAARMNELIEVAESVKTRQ